MSLISGLLGHYDLGDTRKALSETEPLPFGANFALRRPVAESLGRFDPCLGVIGAGSGRGEEAEYLARARQAGIPGIYVPDATCFHRIRRDRFKLRFLYRYGKEKGRAAAIVGTLDVGQPWRQGEYAARGVFQLLKGRGDRFRQCIINMGIQRGLAMEQRRNSKT